MFSLRRTAAILCLVLAFAASPVFAAAKATTAPAPDFSNNPLLVNIAKMGAKLYYLGNQSGLDGWFIVKDGRVQIAYTMAGKKIIMIGAMFGEDGESISSAQVKALLESNKDIVSQLSGVSKELEAAKAAIDSAKTASPNSVSPASTPAISTPDAASVATPPATMAPSASSPGERLYQQLSGATGVTLGNASPRLYMIMDTGCPHCQATWRLLRDSVKNNVVQLRMIPIAAPDSDSERAAVQLLRSPDPLNAWDKYVGPAPGQGDKSQLVGTNDAALVSALRANHTMTDSWHIDQTPYMVYRGKDGKVKIVVGEPDKLSNVINDVAP